MSELLFEIGTEEIPAGYIAPALKELSDGLKALLKENRLDPEQLGSTGTPRRLTVWARGVPEKQGGVREEITGPPAAVAYDEDGNPGKAAIGFARAQGVDVEDLEVRETDKGPYVVAVQEKEGAPTLEILPDLLREATLSIAFPKSMRWPHPAPGDDPGLSFARPVRHLVALLDSEVIPVEIAGVRADRLTCGHPFLAPDPFALPSASYEEYKRLLRENYVVCDLEERRESVREQVQSLHEAHAPPQISEPLLDEVTNLVEYPHAIEGSFAEEFLAVPDCVLAAAMTEHQRYFPVRDADGQMLNRFVIVSNRTEKQEETVREGNELVLRARLADARFFWDEDRKISLEERVPDLAGVVYLGGLGNNLDRTERLEALAARIADLMGLSEEKVEKGERAAHLCKADLLTDLVGEFPSLQGVVGGELAADEGKNEAVATAIAEHYRPAGAEDNPPESALGAALALADKLDCIAGCFALGQLPSGSQDPYGLRRSALGIMLTLETRGIDLSLSALLEAAREVLENQAPRLGQKELQVPVEKALEFFRGRLYNDALERGYPYDLVRAALAVGFDREVPDEHLNHNVCQFWRRLTALRKCSEKEWWPALVELVDRTYRIQRDGNGQAEPQEPLLEEDEERLLFELLAQHGDSIRASFEAGQYVEAAELYCSALADPVHEFFENVFVNVDDQEVRQNRKALCGAIYRLFADRFADLYLIESAEEPQ